MSRVIKAGLTRLLPPREQDPPEDTAAEQDSTEEGDGEETPAIPQEVQAAYDELIEAATNEVAYMLEDARRGAANLYAEATRQSEQMTTEARAKGYAEGREEGIANGMDFVRESFKSLFEEGQQTIDRLKNDLETEFRNRLENLREDLLRLSLDIAEKIIGQTLDENTEAFHSLVQTALDAVMADTDLSVRLNPVEFLAHYQERNTIYNPGRDMVVPITPDTTVPAGGCWIDTESGVADASVDAQLEQIAYHLGLTRD